MAVPQIADDQARVIAKVPEIASRVASIMAEVDDLVNLWNKKDLGSVMDTSGANSVEEVKQALAQVVPHELGLNTTYRGDMSGFHPGEISSFITAIWNLSTHYKEGRTETGNVNTPLIQDAVTYVRGE